MYFMYGTAAVPDLPMFDYGAAQLVFPMSGRL
jgi:hypothetical protein